MDIKNNLTNDYTTDLAKIYGLSAILATAFIGGIVSFLLGTLNIYYGILIGAIIAIAYVYGSGEIETFDYIWIAIFSILGALLTEYVFVILVTFIRAQVPFSLNIFIDKFFIFNWNRLYAQPMKYLYLIFAATGALVTTIGIFR